MSTESGDKLRYDTTVSQAQNKYVAENNRLMIYNESSSGRVENYLSLRANKVQAQRREMLIISGMITQM